MSEKRFKKVMGFIQDNTCERGDVEGVMDLTEIEDTLNEQQVTIEMYKRSVDKREEQISIIKKYCLKFLTDEQFEIIRKALEDELV